MSQSCCSNISSSRARCSQYCGLNHPKHRIICSYFIQQPVIIVCDGRAQDQCWLMLWCLSHPLPPPVHVHPCSWELCNMMSAGAGINNLKVNTWFVLALVYEFMLSWFTRTQHSLQSQYDGETVAQLKTNSTCLTCSVCETISFIRSVELFNSHDHHQLSPSVHNSLTYPCFTRVHQLTPPINNIAPTQL